MSQGEEEDPVVDVDDRLDGKGTGGEKHQLGAVEEEGNSGGVEGKRGLEWNKWRENHYGWDFIFSGEEEGGLVVEGNYIFFHDRRSVFLQWAWLGFRVGVNYFSSAEKLFMHEKALFAGDLLKAREIMGEDRPWELRRLGREVRWLNEGDWRRRAPNVVYKGNRAKFLQNEGARWELFESRWKVLVEASRGDRFWGSGLGMGDGRKGDPSKWEGQNVLGRVLIQLRKDLWREGGYRIW